MVLVDTSVWINHLRSKNAQLTRLLEYSQVFIHPMIIGELACGNLRNRQPLLNLWKNMPCVIEASHDEVLHCLEQNKLMGKGLGFIDLYLLASTMLTFHAFLWTRDRRLQQAAEELDLCWTASP